MRLSLTWEVKEKSNVTKSQRSLDRLDQHRETGTSRGSSQSRDQTRVSCIAGRFFTAETLGRPLLPSYLSLTPALGWHSLSLGWPMPVYANAPAIEGQIPVKKVGNSPEAPPLLP